MKYIHSFLLISALALLQFPFSKCWGNSFTASQDFSNQEEVYHDDFFFISVPKCGTHLLSKTVSLLVHKTVDEGYDWVYPKDFNNKYKVKFLSILNRAKEKGFIHKTHVPWFPSMEEFFLSTNHKWLFQIRDPRDAVISLVFYLEKLKPLGNRRDFFRLNSAIYDGLTLEEKISAVMTGACCLNYLKIWMKNEIPWALSPYCECVRFEDLIGVEGGGSKELQIDTLHRISQYLNIDISSEEISSVADRIYSPWKGVSIDGIEYQPGKVGSWKLFFTEEHKNIFKSILGDELIQLGYENDYQW